MNMNDDDVRLISNDETSSSSNAAIVNDNDVVGGLVEEVVVVDERVLWYNRTMRVFLSPIDMTDDDYHHYVKKINYISGFPILLLVDYNSSVMKLIGQEDSNVASIDLDLLASISKEKTVVSIHNNNDNNDDNNNDSNNDDSSNDNSSTIQGDYVHVMYSYTRKGAAFHLNVFFSITRSDPNVLKDIEDSILELEFIFKQYTLWTFYDDNNNDTNNQKAHEDDRKPNNIARGFEKTGVLLREGLKAGGRSTGEAIRFLGKKYTENTLKWKSRQSVASESRVADGDDISRSEPRLVEQDDIDKAKLMKERGESVHAGIRTVTSTALRPIRYLGEAASKMAAIKKDEKDSRRPILDTVGGVGNALSSVFKGVTEAWSEIGSATSDAALYHSRHLHGNDYADAVTKHYVEGMGEIALGLYKGINVATLGVHGLVLDAVVEGTMLSISLYEFLVGPVIIQDYMDIITLPSLKKTRVFLVLRPWSIAIYETASCFCKRPIKLIATSMLDTIPKLRRKEAHDTDAENVAGNNDPTLFDKLKGTETHIEICTVDCSTYLLFPNPLLLEKLFNELELACRRVETIDKRNSGALEIAVERRLSLMPKETFIKLSLFEVVLASNLEEDNQDIYDLADKKTHIPAAVDAEADISYLPLATDEVEVDRKTTPTTSSTNLVSLTDKISELKYNFFKSCEVTILPLTHHGVGIVSEKVTSSSTKLEHEQLENDEKRYSASWDEEHILLGKNACLSPSELKLIQFSIYCESTVKSKVRVGTAKVLLNKLSGTTENIWIDLKKKGKVEAKLRLAITIFGT